MNHERLTSLMLIQVSVYKGIINEIDYKILPLSNEVEEVKWASQLEILELVKGGRFVDYGVAYFSQVIEYM